LKFRRVYGFILAGWFGVVYEGDGFSVFSGRRGAAVRARGLERYVSQDT